MKWTVSWKGRKCESAGQEEGQEGLQDSALAHGIRRWGLLARLLFQRGCAVGQRVWAAVAGMLMDSCGVAGGGVEGEGTASQARSSVPEWAGWAPHQEAGSTSPRHRLAAQCSLPPNPPSEGTDAWQPIPEGVGWGER